MLGSLLPYSVNQEIYFDFLPVNHFINSGIWTFLLEPVYIVAGEFQMYLPGQAVRTDDTRFFDPTPELTLTIPSTAGKLITVGAIQGDYDAYADFSGRGVRGQERAPRLPQHQAGSRRAWRKHRYGPRRRRSRGLYRNLLRGSTGDRSRRAFDGMGDRKRKRSVPLWGKAEGLSSARSQESQGRGSFAKFQGRIWSNVRRGQPAGNLTGGQGTVTTENGRFLFFS